MLGFVVCCEKGAGQSLDRPCDDGLFVILLLITVLQAPGWVAPQNAFLHLPLKSVTLLAGYNLAENDFHKQWLENPAAPENVLSAVWLIFLAQGKKITQHQTLWYYEWDCLNPKSKYAPSFSCVGLVLCPPRAAAVRQPRPWHQARDVFRVNEQLGRSFLSINWQNNEIKWACP